MENPIYRTTAYKIVAADERSGSLSHTYLVCCQDEGMLDTYLTELAKVVACGDRTDSAAIRIKGLIDKKIHPDVSFYPKEKRLTVANADEIVEQSLVKPMELDKRLFILNKFEELAQYQNKLLKTLEEPPQNVVLILGTVNETAVLPTVRSRSKILSIPLFLESDVVGILKSDCPDAEKLDLCAFLGGGKLGETLRLYEQGDAEDIFRFTLSLLGEMNGAGDMLKFADKMKAFNVKDVISVLKLVCGEALKGGERTAYLNGKLRAGVYIGIIEKLNGFEKAANFNGNQTMLADGVLFAVMEEKVKWQKL